MATIYRDIGKFNREITLQIEEASDKGKYKPYWDQIKELVELINQDSDESEIVKLELYKLTMYSVEMYARKFKADGVEESDIRSVIETVKESTNQLSVSAEKTMEIKNDVISRFEGTEKAIDNAYRNT